MQGQVVGNKLFQITFLVRSWSLIRTLVGLQPIFQISRPFWWIQRTRFICAGNWWIDLRRALIKYEHKVSFDQPFLVSFLARISNPSQIPGMESGTLATPGSRYPRACRTTNVTAPRLRRPSVPLPEGRWMGIARLNSQRPTATRPFLSTGESSVCHWDPWRTGGRCLQRCCHYLLCSFRLKIQRTTSRRLDTIQRGTVNLIRKGFNHST